ncbi:MAG: glycosyltransferase [Ruminococcaceae bacterium]|nr:glycosyltransferase [Oscillospiraceae bacterium]
MKDIKVSVVCLAYNHEKYIRETLDGFVKQKTDFPFEVIVHDDASTDGTADIIREYEKKYPDLFVVIYQTENMHSKKLPGGIIKNFIIPVVRGKYVALCEGDDYWTNSSKLQQQYDIMENDSELSFCTHKTRCIKEDGSIMNLTIPAKNDFGTGKLNETQCFNAAFLYNGGYSFHTSSYFFRKELLYYRDEKLGFLCGYLAGDQQYIWSALTCGKFYYIDKTMSSYRMFSNNSWSSVWNSSKEKQINNALNVIKAIKMYDEFTEYKYHDLLYIRLFHEALVVFLNDEKLAKQIIKKNHINLKNILQNCKNTSLFFKLKYAVPITFPIILKIWKRKNTN